MDEALRMYLEQQKEAAREAYKLETLIYALLIPHFKNVSRPEYPTILKEPTHGSPA